MVKKNELVRDPPVFNGKKPSPRKWLDEYERAAEANCWTDFLKAMYMPTFLRDSAYNWFLTFPRRIYSREQIPWPDLRSSFMRHFLAGTDTQALGRELHETYQGSKETATKFILRILRMMELVEPSKPEEEIVEFIK